MGRNTLRWTLAAALTITAGAVTHQLISAAHTRTTYGTTTPLHYTNPDGTTTATDSDGTILMLSVVRRHPHTLRDLAETAIWGHSTSITKRPDPVAAATTGTNADIYAADTTLERSLDQAWVAAHRLLHQPVNNDTVLVIVDAPDNSVIPPGSRILAVAGQPINSTNARNQISRLNGPVTVAVDGHIFNINTLDSSNYRWDYSVKGYPDRPQPYLYPNLHGPSGGLAHTLAYTDHLDTGDLTAGLTIAATGTINIRSSGTKIGSVGSVDKKTVAAIDAGADVLFVPAANYNQAEQAATTRPANTTKIVAVNVARDATNWLCDHGATSSICATNDNTNTDAWDNLIAAAEASNIPAGPRRHCVTYAIAAAHDYVTIVYPTHNAADHDYQQHLANPTAGVGVVLTPTPC